MTLPGVTEATAQKIVDGRDPLRVAEMIAQLGGLVYVERVARCTTASGASQVRALPPHPLDPEFQYLRTSRRPA